MQSKTDTGAWAPPIEAKVEFGMRAHIRRFQHQQVWASNPAGTIYDPPLRLEVWGAICRSRIRSQSLTCVPQKNCSAILFFLAPHECTQLVCIPIERWVAKPVEAIPSHCTLFETHTWCTIRIQAKGMMMCRKISTSYKSLLLLLYVLGMHLSKASLADSFCMLPWP